MDERGRWTYSLMVACGGLRREGECGNTAGEVKPVDEGTERARLIEVYGGWQAWSKCTAEGNRHIGGTSTLQQLTQWFVAVCTPK